MNLSTKRILFFTLAMVMLLAACAPAAAPAATQDPALIQQQIQQSVESTVAAQNAQATNQQAVIVPSNTPLPTQTPEEPFTPTPELPTATPFVIIPPTNTAVSVSGGGSGSNPAPKPDYACGVINRKPADNTYYKPDKPFDIKWTIVNTGKKTMVKGLDVKFYSGTQMANVTSVELPELQPGDTYTVDLDGKSPSKQGTYVMTWVVEGQLCFPYTRIIVER